MKIGFAVFSLSPLYKQIINYVFSTANTWIYSFFHSIYVWLYTGFFVAAVALTVRYIITKKSK